MTMTCSAYGCSNRWSPDRRVSFHRFPFSNPKLLQQWIIALRRKSWQPTLYSFVCSEHFPPDAYKPLHRHYLKPDAVPSIFNFSPNSQKTRKRRRDSLPTKEFCSSSSVNLESSGIADESADCSDAGPIKYPTSESQPSTSGFCSQRMSSNEASGTADESYPDLQTHSEKKICVSGPIILKLGNCSTVMQHASLSGETSTTISDDSTCSGSASPGFSVNSRCETNGQSKEMANCSSVTQHTSLSNETSTTISDDPTCSGATSPGFSVNSRCETNGQSKEVANCSTVMQHTSLSNETCTTILDDSICSGAASSGFFVNSRCKTNGQSKEVANCSSVMQHTPPPTAVSDNSKCSGVATPVGSVNRRGFNRGRSKEELRKTVKMLNDKLRRREKRIEDLKSALRQVVEIRKSGLN